jgi:hypothetical protein
MGFMGFSETADIVYFNNILPVLAMKIKRGSVLQRTPGQFM